MTKEILNEQWNKLSPRKKQILWMTVTYHRLTQRHIAEELGIVLSTLRTYMTSILEITGCDDRWHLLVEWQDFLKHIDLPPTSQRSKTKK